MSVAIQTAFAAALETIAGSTPVFRRVAPRSAPIQYVVYSAPMDSGPQARLYGGSYVEDHVFLVSCTAASELAAEQLNEIIGVQLDRYPLDGAIMVRRENRAPMPAAGADQTRFTVGTYYRVTFIGGQ